MTNGEVAPLRIPVGLEVGLVLQRCHDSRANLSRREPVLRKSFQQIRQGNPIHGAGRWARASAGTGRRATDVLSCGLPGYAEGEQRSHNNDASPYPVDGECERYGEAKSGDQRDSLEHGSGALS